MWLHFRGNFCEDCVAEKMVEGFLSVHEVQHRTVGHSTLGVSLKIFFFFVGVTSDPEASFFSALLSFTIFSRKGHSMPGCESRLSKSWDVKGENKMAFSYLPLEFSVNESILRLVSLFPGKWSAGRLWCLPAPVSLGAARLREGRVNTIRLPTRLSWGEVTQELAVGLSGRCCRRAPGGSVCLGRR